MMRLLILAGYFELMMYLQISGKLNQYINTHYRYLAYISMVLALIFAIVQLIVWVKNEKIQSHMTPLAKISSLVILAFPLLIGWTFPIVTLDATIVNSKGFQFPLAEGSGDTSDGTQIQYLQPNTSSYFVKSDYDKLMKETLEKYKNQTIDITTENYMEIMEVIYNFPQAFIGKSVTYTGFVYNDPTDAQAQFLFRFGIIHCIADSGVFGLRTLENTEHFPDNTWIKATGVIDMAFYKPFNRELPVLKVTSFKQIEKPDNPYVYRVF
ncbi:phosphate ABC transporter substrate-binding protein [Lactococcus hodotermopsidis]|uniref:Phosphate ABC transporter substrate-binding protein n=1 Tax=Pseudolactococcus hodotermopsidis TaxID=2709157 RepID=A0A6A0BCI1_9LACT|nr:TIGR03943 family protein [Lactococcus hodotermopsidis]GFH42375.1 phosphate ABC transporter substrate-binding protein [Lactococcus hodotermopsidis]